MPILDLFALPNPSVGSRGEIYLPQVRTPFEGPYVQSRKKYTRARGGPFTLFWDCLSPFEFDALVDFFKANQGGSFACEFLGDGEYRIAGDALKWEWLPGKNRKVHLVLEEV